MVKLRPLAVIWRVVISVMLNFPEYVGAQDAVSQGFGQALVSNCAIG
jgi:hypothetical protein